MLIKYKYINFIEQFKIQFSSKTDGITPPVLLVSLSFDYQKAVMVQTVIQSYNG